MIQSENKLESLSIYPALLNELLLQHRQAIVLVNSDGVITFSTESVRLMTGYESKELVGHTASEFLDPVDVHSARQQYEYVIRNRINSFAALVRLRNKSGVLIWIDAVMKNLLHVPSNHSLFVLLKKSCDTEAEERKLLRAITAAREEEREFIACELHDNVNQIITATKLLVDGARINNNNREELLELSSANLQLVIDEIRSLSHSMTSSQLNHHGFAFVIDTFIGNVSKTGSVRFKTKLEPSAAMALTTDQQLQVYRIIQEAINNILRHAAATQAEIALTRQDQLVNLVVKDNGIGLSKNRFKPGLGLSSMTNRVKILKGHFQVRTPQDGGTIIEIQFPE